MNLTTRRVAAGATALALLAFAPAASADHSVVEHVSTGPSAAPDGAFSTQTDAVSSDGSRIFFQTSEVLVPEDADVASDVYMRSGGATTLVTGGSSAASEHVSTAQYSRDGRRVFFATDESLVAADGDGSTDLYQWTDGTIALVSDRTASGADAEQDVEFRVASDDGTRVAFSTRESLTADDVEDTAGRIDVFVWDGTAVERASRANDQATDEALGDVTSLSVYMSTSGSHVYLVTDTKFDAANDTDTCCYADLYGYDVEANSMEMLSDSEQAGPDGSGHVQFGMAAANGERVAYHTPEPITAADGDAQEDVYINEAGASTLESIGPDPDGPSGDARPVMANPALTQFLFTSDERLDARSDPDAAQDIYRRTLGAGAATELVSAGDSGDVEISFAGATPDLTHVFLETPAPLAGDPDSGGWDVFQRSGGTTTLISTGPAAPASDADIWFVDASDDGSRVFLDTDEQLTADDADSAYDVFERHAGTTTRISPGDHEINAWFAGASRDGRTVALDSDAPIASSDTEDQSDVYAVRVPAPPADQNGGDDTGGGDDTSGGGDTNPTSPPRDVVVPAPDTRGPLAAAAGRRSQRVLKQGGLLVSVTSDEDGTLKAGGTVNVPGAAKAYRFKAARSSVRAGVKQTVKLKLAKKPLRAVRRALKSGRKLKAKVTVTITDAAGNRSTKALTIRLKR